LDLGRSKPSRPRPLPLGPTLGVSIYIYIYIFFDKSKYYIKKYKGAQPLVCWEYTKGFRGREKIWKGNLQS
jgi:hypothetical protein